MKHTILLKSYLGFSAIYLIIILLGLEDLAWYMKPFLIPFLLLCVYFCTSFPTKKFLLVALLFSWFGDILLLFADKGELYFILGLVAFLISHLVYIILFSKQTRITLYHNKAIFWVGTTAIISYLIVLYSILLPSLGDLRLPVLAYALVLSTMLLFAFKGYFKWHKPASIYILCGAIIFVSSDSILAFNKFYTPIKYSSFLIMTTYIAAQYLIVSGILKLNKLK